MLQRNMELSEHSLSVRKVKAHWWWIVMSYTLRRIGELGKLKNILLIILYSSFSNITFEKSVINHWKIKHHSFIDYMILSKNRSHSQHDIDFLKYDSWSTQYFSKIYIKKLYIHMRPQHFLSKYYFIFHIDRIVVHVIDSNIKNFQFKATWF